MAGKRHKTVLVIRLSAMGDVAMTIPVLLAHQEKYPESKQVLLTKAHFAPIFSGLKNVVVHSVDVKGSHKGVFGIFRIFKELRQYKIDAVADLHNVLRSKILRSLFTLVGIESARVDKGRSEKRDLIVWEPSKKLRQLKSTHTRYADVFKGLGYSLELEKVRLLSKQTLPGHFKPNHKILIGIAPFASYTSKAYPLGLVEGTITLLLQKRDCQVLLFGGGKKEVDALGHLADGFGDEVHNMAGKYSFQEELAVISNLDLMVSADSGNGHLAANFDVPVLTLWGVTHPCLGFAPFKQPKKNQLLADRQQFPLVPTSVYGNKYPEGYGLAIASITPARIVDKILEVLKA